MGRGALSEHPTPSFRGPSQPGGPVGAVPGPSSPYVFCPTPLWTGRVLRPGGPVGTVWQPGCGGTAWPLLTLVHQGPVTGCPEGRSSWPVLLTQRPAHLSQPTCHCWLTLQLQASSLLSVSTPSLRACWSRSAPGNAGALGSARVVCGWPGPRKTLLDGVALPLPGPAERICPIPAGRGTLSSGRS